MEDEPKSFSNRGGVRNILLATWSGAGRGGGNSSHFSRAASKSRLPWRREESASSATARAANLTN